jgi:hypothetical protein
MQIRLTRLSNEQHRLEVIRDDGSRFERELETRSLLLHDLVHYAVEAEAGLENGFWGLLASGVDIDELRGEPETPTHESIMFVEKLVGPMQAMWQKKLGAQQYVDFMSQHADFVDPAFVDTVIEHIRHLWGHWQGTPFHEAMELSWPPKGWSEQQQ